jgi:hypothetical protein
MTLSQPSGVCSRALPGRDIPALHTSTSSRPATATASATARSASSGTPVSAWMAIPSISPASSSSGSRLRPVTATR